MSEPPETTPDGRYLVLAGRRWRATDPLIPAARRAELTKTLMRRADPRLTGPAPAPTPRTSVVEEARQRRLETSVHR